MPRTASAWPSPSTVADPLQRPVNGVSIGEDVVGRLPVGVLVGAAEARHPERRRIGERAAEVGGRGPGSDRRLDGVHDRGRIVAEERLGRALRDPTSARAPRPAREQVRQFRSRRVAQSDEIDRLTPGRRLLGTARGDHLADHASAARRQRAPSRSGRGIRRPC